MESTSPNPHDADADATGAVVVLTTIGATADAAMLARTLVDERLVACVNVLAPMTSIYRWKDAIEEEPERQLVMKTLRGAVPALHARLVALHPYELPEFLVLDAAASEAYLAWIRDGVRVDTSPAGRDNPSGTR